MAANRHQGQDRSLRERWALSSTVFRPLCLGKSIQILVLKRLVGWSWGEGSETWEMSSAKAL